MPEERTTLTVGQPIGSVPPKEGYMPVLNGLSFDKEACFHQPSKFSSMEECQKAVEGILDKYSSATLRAMLRR